MTPPAVITMPLSSFENMRFELACRLKELLDQVRDILEDLNDIKTIVSSSDTSESFPPSQFDPFKTFGKY